jgi:hypothetical protein
VAHLCTAADRQWAFGVDGDRGICDGPGAGCGSADTQPDTYSCRISINALFCAAGCGYSGIALFAGGNQLARSALSLLGATFWLLLGSAGIVWLLRWAATAAGRPYWTAALAGSACVAIALYTITGWSALDRQEENFEQAFTLVSEQRGAESAVLSPQPPACAWVLGEPCDGYAIQRGYEEYVIPNAEGTLVDRWTGAPLIDTPEKLAAVIRDHPQTWLVSDAFRLATRYDQTYLRTIIEQFSPIAEEEGAMVLRADGWKEDVRNWTRALSFRLHCVLVRWN